jgi:DNA-binding IclR family transcriptional regulator
LSSLGSALAILQCFSAESPHLGIAEVAARLGMPKSSVWRWMRTMADAHLLEQDAVRRTFRPGVLSFQLGNLYQRHLTVLDLVDESLQELVESTGLTGYIGVLNGAELVIIQSRQGAYPVRLVLEKGYRVPAFATAAGLALLSRLDDAAVRRLHPAVLHHGETGFSHTIDDLIAEVRDARERGVVQILGRTFAGFNAIGVAVESGAERQRLGFSLSYPVAALGPDQVESITGCMIDAAIRIGEKTGDRYWEERSGRRAGPPAAPVGVACAGLVSQLSKGYEP